MDGPASRQVCGGEGEGERGEVAERMGLPLDRCLGERGKGRGER